MRVEPLARQASLVVKEVDDETLVYDLETDKAHCLNSTAALVWKSCDGRTSVDEIARLVNAKTDSGPDESIVWLALDQLEKFNLLEKPVSALPRFEGVSRRDVVRTLGLAAIMLPVVTSIVVPAAAAVASCEDGKLPNGSECEEDDDCCSGNCQPTGQSFVCNAAG